MAIHSVWGDEDTQFFYELTPERILDAVEDAGFRCTGRVLALNSLENRVYEVEVELDHEPVSPSEAFRVVKFYRPGRWSAEQIAEEHEFLADLAAADLPVIPPVVLPDGGTLGRLGAADLVFAVFPKRGGRVPDELSDELAGRLGALMARVHNVGAQHDAEHRIELSPDTYGRDNLQWLLEHDAIAPEVRRPYAATVEAICDLSEPWFAEDAVAYQRIHGDAHLGNVLMHPDEGLRLVDFDDMVWGPCVQDLWLACPARDDEGMRRWSTMLTHYEDFRAFDRSSARLIEPLRALRFVHFSAWIAKRWQDPAFPDVFPGFGSERYWAEQLADLQNQLSLMRGLG